MTSICLLTGLVLFAGAADPATMNADGVLPIARPAQVRACVAELQLSESAQDTVGLVVEDYEATLADAHAAMLDRIAGARAQLDEAFAGRRRIAPDALRALRVTIAQAPASVWPRADTGLTELVDTMGVMSMQDQARVNRSLATFKRKVLQASMPASKDVSAAAIALDVEELARAAVQTELQGADQTMLDQALLGYRARLDSAVPAWFDQWRSASVDDAIADIGADRDTRVALMKASAARWMAGDALHGPAIEAVAAIAQQAGGEASRAAWISRVNQARYPDLYADDQLDGLRNWVERNGSDHQQATVQAAYATWLTSVRSVADTMVTLMRQAYAKGGDVQHPAIAWHEDVAEIRRKWLQASGDRQVKLETARAAIERELTDGQRAAARRSMIDQRR